MHDSALPDTRLFVHGREGDRTAAADHGRVTSKIVDPGRLSDEERSALVDALYGAHQRIFDGVDRDVFAAYVVCSSAERTRIQIFEAEGRVVGYAAVHFFAREVRGERAWIIRCEAGIERTYRGKTLMRRFVFGEAFFHILGHMRARHYFMACPVHPASYRRVAENYALTFPAAGRTTPPELRALMLELADDFGLARMEGEPDDVRRVGWVSRETPEESARWRSHASPHVQFFIERNPHYAQGCGMLMLAPASWPALLRTALRLATR